ncbi:MAG: hypothetical protein H6563_10980 [Lewinellaceae bacterium]|nr:hypothetical protein [Lewinellaceae bacterium]
MKDFFPFLLIIVVGFAFGCQKNHIITPPPEIPIPCHSQLELIPITDTCFEPLPIDSWGYLPAYIGQNDFYRFAAFDPSSYEKFLFYHELLYDSLSVKGANLCTGEFWTIQDSISFSRSLSRIPKWSEKGWILLTRWIGDNAMPWERGLYKIKPNGDSLVLLLNNNTILYPTWTEQGNSILVGWDDTYFQLNENGEILDTLDYLLTYPSSYESKIAARRIAPPDFVEIVVYQDGEITWSYPYTEDFFNFRGLDWLNEEEIVWINDSGIYRANTVTNQIELVKEVCPNIFYSSISAARDGSNRLLLTRRDYLFENGITDSMSVRYNISLYDMDTGEEYYVKLGEM